MSRTRVALLAGVAAAAACGGAWAQPAPPRERTGPEAAPPPTPAYAQPAPALAAPQAPARQIAPPAAGGALKDLRITADVATGEARPPADFRPPEAPGTGLALEHAPGRPLDEAWVRRQFELNGLGGPGADAARALALVQLVNRAFLAAGFINSGLVAQPAESGVLDLRLVYGGLAAPAAGGEAISVSWGPGGSKGLDAAYVRGRVPAAAVRPLNAADLERDFRLLAEDPALRSVNAELRPGSRPGEASLAFSVYPQDRYDLYVTGANDRSPAVGGERASIGGSVRNVAFAGDLLSGGVGITDGLKDVTLSYLTPFLTPRTALSLRGALDNAVVVAQPLSALDIKARDRSYEAGLTHRVIDAPLLPTAQAGRWSPARTLSGGVLIAGRTSRSYLLGQPFSFAPGFVDGRSRYTVVRLVGDYLVRNVDQVFAVSVTASRGLSGTGSDLPGLPSPKPHFGALLAQVNYARRLMGDGLELRARLSGQLTNSDLYSGERFAAGGINSVRGYRENAVLADNGVVGSVELSHPLRLSRGGGGRGFDWGAFQVSAFADGAAVRNHSPPQPQQRLYSLGVSATWVPSDVISAQVTYGKALKKAENQGRRDLQDRGVSFRVTLHPLRLKL